MTIHHDPLGGPEEAAAIARQEHEQRDNPQRRFVPMKIVGDLIGAWYDADGQVVSEHRVGPIAIYAPGFDKLKETVDREWPDILRSIQQIEAEPSAGKVS